MICCNNLDQALDLEIVVKTEKHLLHDGRILNDVDSEYFVRASYGSDRFNYLAINYCPFCGRVLSRGLWNAEKKK
ncbi:MAG TPA: hypothetical protein VIH17_00805 [Candidatus Acidoferrales bacterium]